MNSASQWWNQMNVVPQAASLRSLSLEPSNDALSSIGMSLTKSLSSICLKGLGLSFLSGLESTSISLVLLVSDPD